jgi:predicted flap endonuclease-1-like 5' DNA nuclease
VIWHFFEIWGLLVAAFVVGCLFGALLYLILAVGPFARAQGALADAVGDTIDGLKRRLGLAPAWAPEYRRVSPRSRDDRDVDFDDRAFPPAAETRVEDWETAPLRDDGEDAATEAAWEPPPPEVDWEGEPVWEEEEAVAAIDAEADRASGAEAVPPPSVAPPPPPAPVVEAKSELPAMRPLTLTGPRNGVPDDLQRIRGIGQRNEELLNGLGIFHFGQIAAWTPAEARWIGGHIAFPERIERDDWVGQAIILATGGDTGYVKAPDRRKPADEDESRADAE